MRKVRILSSILLVFALQANEGFCCGRKSSAPTKFENVQSSKDVNPVSFGNELELPGNMKAFAGRDFILNVKCNNGKILDVHNFSELVPATWNNYKTQLSFDTAGSGNVKLNIYENSPNVSISNIEKCLNISFNKFVSACAFNMPYPEIVDESEVISAPAPLEDQSKSRQRK